MLLDGSIAHAAVHVGTTTLHPPLWFSCFWTLIRFSFSFSGSFFLRFYIFHKFELAIAIHVGSIFRLMLVEIVIDGRQRTSWFHRRDLLVD